MGVEVVNRSWLSQNLTRNYPLTEWAPRWDNTNSFQISNDLLVELYFPTGPGISIDPGRFYISSVAVFATGISISVGYADGTGLVETVAIATVATSAVNEFTPIPLYGINTFTGSVGKLVIGKLDGTYAQGAGQYVFTQAATSLDVDCIRPQLSGIASITVMNNNGVGVPLTGQIQLNMGSNFSIGMLEAGTLQFNAIQGAGLTAPCSCAGLPVTATPITSINGVTVTNGAATIVGDACLNVTTKGNGLQLQDSCSSPCCGCTELQTLQQNIDYILDQLRSMRDFQNRLQNAVSSLNNVALASSISSSGCTTCS